MAKNELSSYVSGGIARKNPLEGGPALEAWRNGTNIMASTWGDYVSRLAELLGEADVDILLSKLCIDRDELRDPSVHFDVKSGGEGEFVDYKERFRRASYKEITDCYAPEIARLQMTLDTILEGYRVPDQDEARKEAKLIQEEITQASELFRVVDDPTPEQQDAYDIEQDERCMRRGALVSGTVIPLAEFVDAILQVNLIHSGDFQSELAHVWVRALSAALDRFFDEYGHAPNMPVSRIVVGREIFDNMRDNLGDIWPEQRAHYEQRWAEVEPVFITTRIQEHPLVKGVGEK